MLPQIIDDIIEFNGDMRVKGSYRIWQPLMIMLIYVLAVTKLGPWFMKKKKPYNIKHFIMTFDAIQVIANFYFMHQVISVVIRMTGSYFCLDLDSSDSDLARYSLFLTKFYYWLKISDLLDTVFFVLKKSWRQVSYLHLYHHTIMVFLSWLAIKMAPGGHCAYFGLANSFTHTVMYSYYLLTAYDPSYKTNIPVKKFVTQLQLVQFVFVFIMYLPTLSRSCPLPSIIGLAAVTQACYFFYLFGMFYYNNYVKTNKDEEQKGMKTR